MDNDSLDSSGSSDQRGIANLKTLLPLLRKHALVLALGFTFMVAQNYGYVRVPGYVQELLDEITGPNRRAVVASLIGMIGIYTAATGICLFFMRKLIIGVSRKVEYSIRSSIYSKLLRLDQFFYQKHQTGDLVSRSTNDLNDVRTLLGPGLMYVPNSLSRLLLFMPVLFRLSGKLMIVVCGVIVVLITFIVVVLPRFRPLFHEVQRSTAKISNRVWQVVSGILTLKLHAAEQNEIERFRQLNQEYIRKHMAVVRFRGFLWPLLSLLISVSELVVLLVGGRQVIEGAMTLGELLQFTIMVGYLTFPILSLGWIMSLLQQGISAMTRINVILRAAEESAVDLLAVSGDELSFRVANLSFSYPGQPNPTLKDLNFHIRSGQFVGITGTVGSGKSTLLAVLTRTLKPEAGMVYVNEVDICQIDPTSLYVKTGIVSQDPFLFSCSVSENIALGLESQADEAQIREATRLAGLGQDIDAFPDRYDQLIGERGVALSGGQKQRMAIARALVRNSRAIVLDDAFSSVDSRTEAEIVGNLRAFAGTIIMVSHRISPLRRADWVLVLDEGQIVEQGTHDTLLQNEGLYARLSRLQRLESAISSRRES